MKYDIQENWIPVGHVSEPEDNTDILIVMDDDVHVAWFYDDEYILQMTGEAILPTHWMPAPRLPKEK